MNGGKAADGLRPLWTTITPKLDRFLTSVCFFLIAIPRDPDRVLIYEMYWAMCHCVARPLRRLPPALVLTQWPSFTVNIVSF